MTQDKLEATPLESFDVEIAIENTFRVYYTIEASNEAQAVEVLQKRFSNQNSLEMMESVLRDDGTRIKVAHALRESFEEKGMGAMKMSAKPRDPSSSARTEGRQNLIHLARLYRSMWAKA